MRWGVEIISFPWGKAGAAKGVDAGPKEGKTAPPMRTLFPRVSLALSAALAVSALAPSALAITFDEAGVPAFDAKATVKISFDDPTGISGVTVGTGTSLEGKGYLVIKGGGGGGGGGGSRPSIPLTLPKEKKAYVARLFARKNRVVGSVGVEYTDGTPGFDAQFFPTGRVTSDGWYEIETARFSVDGTKDLKASTPSSWCRTATSRPSPPAGSRPTLPAEPASTAPRAPAATATSRCRGCPRATRRPSWCATWAIA